ncbi:MAG: hypothetical protein WC960_05305 [Bacteroidales bacterium]
METLIYIVGAILLILFQAQSQKRKQQAAAARRIPPLPPSPSENSPTSHPYSFLDESPFSSIVDHYPLSSPFDHSPIEEEYNHFNHSSLSSDIAPFSGEGEPSTLEIVQSPSTVEKSSREDRVEFDAESFIIYSTLAEPKFLD